ncbi:MAG: hypothetical protein JJU45_07110 [Acidimicrobiia bacterium]|nr:hypothetical protein [Acidimicrobiia bacterium]
MKLTNHGHGPVDVTVDVTDWFSSTGGPPGGTLTAADPQRVTGSTPLGVASASTEDVAGVGDIPEDDVVAVVATVTVSEAAADGPIVVYSPDEVSLPGTAPGEAMVVDQPGRTSTNPAAAKS